MINQSLSKYATHENSAYPQLWRGCVGAWCPSLGPSGSRLFDHSRRQNWGTLTNMDPATDWVVDGGAYAIDIDAVDDGVGCGNAIISGGACSVSGWMRRNGAPTNNNAIVCAKGGLQGDANSTFALYYNAVQGWSWFVVSDGGTLAIVRTNTSTSTGIWYHVCGVASSTGVAIYVDGELRNTAAGGTAKSSTHATNIGSLTDTVGSYIGNCMIDDVRVYNRALFAPEVRLLARRRGIAFTPRTRRLAPFEQAAGGATPWLYARRQSRIIGGGVS